MSKVNKLAREACFSKVLQFYFFYIFIHERDVLCKY